MSILINKWINNKKRILCCSPTQDYSIAHGKFSQEVDGRVDLAYFPAFLSVFLLARVPMLANALTPSSSLSLWPHWQQHAPHPHLHTTLWTVQGCHTEQEACKCFLMTSSGVTLLVSVMWWETQIVISTVVTDTVFFLCVFIIFSLNMLCSDLLCVCGMSTPVLTLWEITQLMEVSANTVPTNGIFIGRLVQYTVPKLQRGANEKHYTLSAVCGQTMSGYILVFIPQALFVALYSERLVKLEMMQPRPPKPQILLNVNIIIYILRNGFVLVIKFCSPLFSQSSSSSFPQRNF